VELGAPAVLTALANAKPYPVPDSGDGAEPKRPEGYAAGRSGLRIRAPQLRVREVRHA
jgi:hypothetical protein